MVIDACRDHGIWFDAQELESVLRWVRKGGEVVVGGGAVVVGAGGAGGSGGGAGGSGGVVVGTVAGPVTADATGGNQGYSQLVCLLGNYVDVAPSAAAQTSLYLELAAGIGPGSGLRRILCERQGCRKQKNEGRYQN